MTRFSILLLVACGSSSSPHQTTDAPVSIDAPKHIDAMPDTAAPVGCFQSVGPRSGPLRIFFTSASSTGNLKAAGGGMDGLDGGDCLCATAARNAHLGGKWRAWLSTTTVNAIERIQGTGPWNRLVDNQLVFATKTALSQAPAVPVKYDETGGTGGEFPAQIWTGTSSGGGMTPTATCNDWTSGLAADHATGGAGYQSTSAWTDDGTYGCSNGQNHVYCIEQN